VWTQDAIVLATSYHDIEEAPAAVERLAGSSDEAREAAEQLAGSGV
jgi:hypothetical protein